MTLFRILKRGRRLGVGETHTPAEPFKEPAEPIEEPASLLAGVRTALYSTKSLQGIEILNVLDWSQTEHGSDIEWEWNGQVNNLLVGLMLDQVVWNWEWSNG